MKANSFLIVFFTVILLFASSIESKSEVKSQVQGKVEKYWTTNPVELQPDKWKAHWIWLPGDFFGKNQMVMARKTFIFKGNARKAMLYISADSHYKLFVNGEFINRDPAVCAAHHQSFDVIDIANVVQPGKNTIALQVHHTGLHRSYYDISRPGILFQLELETIDSQPQVIISDESWKLCIDPAWDPSTPKINNLQSTFTENYNFKQELTGWFLNGFDDSNWANAVLTVPSMGWFPNKVEDSRPTGATHPWTSLVPRDIPYLVENSVKPSAIKQLGETPEFQFWLKQSPQLIINPLKKSTINQTDEFIKGEKPLIINNGTPSSALENEGIVSAFILFDFGRLVTGYPEIALKGPENTVVDVFYSAYLIDDQHFVPGLSYGNFDDKLTLSGKTDLWNASQLKTIRYLALVVRTTSGPVSVEKVAITESVYPFVAKGSLRVEGEPLLEQLWQAGVNTIRGVTTDAYTDNYRERRQYPQTSYYAAKGNYGVFGDPYLQRRYLLQCAQEQLADGRLPMFAPNNLFGEWVTGILDADLFWIMGLHDYLLFSGDKNTVRELLPAANRNLQRFAKMENKSGLIENPPFPYWIDWSNIDRSGANFILNALYLMALENYAQVLEWLDEPGKIGYMEKANSIRISLRNNFWNEGKKLYADAVTDGKLQPVLPKTPTRLPLQRELLPLSKYRRSPSNSSKTKTKVRWGTKYFLCTGLSKGFQKQVI